MSVSRKTIIDTALKTVPCRSVENLSRNAVARVRSLLLRQGRAKLEKWNSNELSASIAVSRPLAKLFDSKSDGKNILSILT